MKTILLAAGYGERLRGMVDRLPKPMVEINGRPILEHNIALLKRHGFVDVYINLHHYPEAIEGYFGNGERHGVQITYSHEERLLGTAGAVRKIVSGYWHKPETFLLLYGDNLFDCDLEKIVACHYEKKGVGTIALHEKEDVRQSGIVLLDRDRRVVRFIEKPGPEEVVSQLVNAGIYVLEPAVLDFIPKAKTVDFGKEVFPEMIRRGEHLYGVILDGHVTSVDTPALLQEALRGGYNITEAS